MPMTLEPIREKAREYFGGVSPSHDWHHVERVTDLSLQLASDENADREIVEPAALLHDIGRKKEDNGEIKDHAQWGAREARTILRSINFAPDRIEAIHHCILSHRYSNQVEPETLEAEVLSDADNLDAMGAIGIARTFAYSGEHGRVLADPATPPEQDISEAGATGLNHLVKKILSLQDRMYTSAGRKLARRRHEVVVNFVDQLRGELPADSNSS